MFLSLIQILKVDEPVTKKSPKDQSEYTVYTAQTALLNSDGVLEKVGRLRIPEAMREKVKVGTFSALFSLEVAQWGLNKGDVIAALVDLQPVPPGGLKAAPAARQASAA